MTKIRFCCFFWYDRITLPQAEGFPGTPYGATKIYIEHLGRFYAKKHNLDVICIRFGGVNERNEIHLEEDPLYDKVLLYKEDFIELIRHCIRIDRVLGNFAIFYAVSDTPRKVHSLNNFLNWKSKYPENETN